MFVYSCCRMLERGSDLEFYQRLQRPSMVEVASTPRAPCTVRDGEVGSSYNSNHPPITHKRVWGISREDFPEGIIVSMLCMCALPMIVGREGLTPLWKRLLGGLLMYIPCSGLDAVLWTLKLYYIWDFFKKKNIKLQIKWDIKVNIYLRENKLYNLKIYHKQISQMSHIQKNKIIFF